MIPINKSNIIFLLGVMLVSLFYFDKTRISIQKEQIDRLEEQLSYAALQSKEKELQFERAKKESQIILQESQLKIKKLLNSKIPKNCEGAIKWGLLQALKIQKKS